ncbi:hypothetical protein JXB02_01310 [Candidatus Woesearchaeota archaeon]|nr:hypothetical protein [Candidatus Woesearchaeota archaeon]
MRIVIVGSGGFLPTPVPTCRCPLCSADGTERTGPCVCMPELGLLIDTPEGVYRRVHELGLDVREVLYSHWHPDHTAGHRIFEHLHYAIGRDAVPTVHLNRRLFDSFKERVSPLFYYRHKGFLKLRRTRGNTITIKGCAIRFIEMRDGISVAYLIRSRRKVVCICMDHAKHLPFEDIPKGMDLLIMNMGSLGGPTGRESHRMPAENATTFLGDNLRIIRTLRPKKTVLIHIEPLLNRSQKELQRLEDEYRAFNIRFGYDGMVLEGRIP